ncbi:hypothetical protein NDU88_003696 [Pleurodeles waltl]|uniref:Uncharacterized protein n=1 Tax=Pleurodeles waltl TaxID=8319 RepID=A0AAV7WVK0_PLEWA|nr:hypothetical protein NDU88_003696 [Pleurodeles waltl]
MQRGDIGDQETYFISVCPHARGTVNCLWGRSVHRQRGLVAGRVPKHGEGKVVQMVSANTITQYMQGVSQRTTYQECTGALDNSGAQLDEPRVELMAAIHGFRTILVVKIDSVSVEVNLLCTDLQKVADNVKTAEQSISFLQLEVKTLKDQMSKMMMMTKTLEERVEDLEC